MRRIFNIITLLLLVGLASCELEPEVQIAENPVAPQMISPANGDAFNLVWDNVEDEMNFVFSPADYGFPAVLTYTIQMDAKGGDFSRARNLGFVSTDTLTITVDKLNNEVKKVKYTNADGDKVAYVDGDVAELDIRVVSSVSEFYPDLISDIITITFVPFSEPQPEEPEEPEEPVEGPDALFLIGAATGAWDTELAIELSKGDDGLFSGLVYFSDANGRNFRFFSDADWGASFGGYDVFETYPDGILEPATEDGDPNFNFVGAVGWYTIVADAVNMTIEMTAADAPELYLTGDATHGWDWDDPVSTVYGTANFIYEGDIDFIQDLAFRVFLQKDWGDSYGYDYLTDYDAGVIDVMEGHDDPNWQFLAESGTYHVKIDLKNLSIEITQ